MLIAPIACLAALLSSAEQNLSTKERSAVIAALVKKLDANYVIAETARKMEAAITTKAARGGYAGITKPEELAKALTEDLIAISKDHHLGVEYSANGVGYDSEKPPDPEVVKKFRESGRRVNFEFRKVERLQGQVGLLEIDGFYPGEWTADTLAASMGFLANSEAIILDLRNNHGGFGDGAGLLCGYFFAEETHLSDSYNRTTGVTRQSWTLPVSPKANLADRDLYILTSHETFSAAEWLAYTLQSLKRATIVGETTGGGAHGTTMFKLDDHFAASIPFNREINPVTKTDWEGVGVKPDLGVPAGAAIVAAHLDALRRSLARHAHNSEISTELTRAIGELKKELSTFGIGHTKG